ESNMNTQLDVVEDIPAGVSKAGCSRPLASGPENGPKPPVQLVYVRDGLTSERWGTGLLGGRKGEANLNGDDYDDILVATYLWDNTATGQTNVGRGVVFFGDGDGLFAVDYPNPTVLEQNGRYNPYSLVPAWEGEELRFFEVNL